MAHGGRCLTGPADGHDERGWPPSGEIRQPRAGTGGPVALGASRGNLVRLLLLECVVLAAVVAGMWADRRELGDRPPSRVRWGVCPSAGRSDTQRPRVRRLGGYQHVVGDARRSGAGLAIDAQPARSDAVARRGIRTCVRADVAPAGSRGNKQRGAAGRRRGAAGANREEPAHQSPWVRKRSSPVDSCRVATAARSRSAGRPRGRGRSPGSPTSQASPWQPLSMACRSRARTAAIRSRSREHTRRDGRCRTPIIVSCRPITSRCSASRCNVVAGSTTPTAAAASWF